MKMLEIRDEKDVVVVSFQQAKILDQTAIGQIGKEFDKLPLEAAADRRLLLNLAKVEFMASAMIGQIMLLSKQCKKHRTDLKLCSISSNIMEIFTLTKLNKILEIHDTEAKALAAFGPPRGNWSKRD
jgi:anti-anti-sigma factor